MQNKIHRKIFYIPGFDPRSANYYKKLLFKEFPKVKTGLKKQEKSRIQFADNAMVVDYEILSWHDCVQNHWLSGLKGNAINVYALFLHFIFKGGYWRGSKVTIKDAIQKGFSIYFFVGWFLIAALSLFLIVKSFQNNLPSIGFASLILVWLFMNALIYKVLDYIHIFWVTRIMRFFALYARHETPDVELKEQQFKEQIQAAIQNPEFDEVVLVGHSVGAILALNIFSRLEQEIDCSKLTVITLGHCVTGVSVVKEAIWYNQKLASLRHHRAFWLDVTSGKDAVNFYKVNPAFDTNAKPDLAVSAGFHRVFDESFYKTLRWDFYKIHFLYLYKFHKTINVEFSFNQLLFDELFCKKLKKESL